MIKLTGAQLLSIGDSGVVDRICVQSLTPIAAYRAKRIRDLVMPEARRIQQARNVLVERPEWAMVNGAGQREVKREFIAPFLESLKPILDEAIEIAVMPLTVEDLMPGASTKHWATVTPDDLELLGSLFKAE